ncbi:MAG: hypothetical protein NVS2B14_14480 [Chamaesiphon sp.]
MAAPHLDIPLGVLILDYLAEHKMTMTELADKAGMTRPSLRGMCLAINNPRDKNIQKLAQALGKRSSEIKALVWQNRVEFMQQKNPLDYATVALVDLIKIIRDKLEDAPDHVMEEAIEEVGEMLKDLKAMRLEKS